MFRFTLCHFLNSFWLFDFDMSPMIGETMLCVCLFVCTGGSLDGSREGLLGAEGLREC